MTPRVLAGIAFVLVASTSIAAASDYSDFRIPAHSTSRLDLSIAGRYAPSKSSREFSETEGNQAAASLSGTWALGYDSEPLQYGLLLKGMAQGTASSDQSRYRLPFSDPSWADRNRDDRSMQELFAPQAFVQGYPTRMPWAVGASISGSARFSQRWTSAQDSSWSPPILDRSRQDGESWAYQYVADASAFTGWGRVRDATGIQQVEFIEERLIHDGVLAGPLELRTRQSLAELFYLRDQFYVVHDQPERFFWSEFERILRTDAALKENTFNAYALMHAGDQVLVAGRLDRQVGFFVGPTLTFRHTNDVSKSSGNYVVQRFTNDTLLVDASGSGGYRYEYDNQRALGGLQASVEQPFGPRWHLSVFSTARADLKGVDEYAELRSGMTLRYWGGERWYASAKVSQFRARGDYFTYYQPGWSVGYGATVSYYLEDHVSLDLGVSQSQSRDWFAYERSSLATLGVSYRRGTLNAPGLVGKVEPYNP